MTLFLPVGSVLYFDTGTDANTPTWTKLSEHNRSSVSLEPNRIEKVQRTSNGTLRKLFIADKTNYSTSWTKLPSFSTMTVDGGYGAVDLQTFYKNKGKGSFKIKISYNGVREEIITVAFVSFGMSLVNRNVKQVSTDVAQEFWDVSISLEQV